jgi:hypothetical protein
MTEQLSKIQWLLAHAIATEVQDLVSCIPQREGEHAYAAPQSIIDTPLRDGRKKDFSVALTTEAVTQGEQLRAQVLKIVNFAIERYPKASRIIHGLPPGVGQIDDRKTPMSEGDQS